VLSLGLVLVAVSGIAGASDPPQERELAGAEAGLAIFQPPAPIDGRGAVPPALILVCGAVVLAFLPRPLRAVLAVALPAAAFWYVLTQLAPGMTRDLSFMGYELNPLRVDRLSRIFGLIFACVGVIGGVYAFHNPDRRQQVAALLYNAGAIGVTFAGDYFTLYVFWELMAIASTVLIWARDREDSHRAGQRYLLVHLAGGSILLAGILMHLGETGSILFEHFAPGSGGAAAWLILLGFAVNAAIPPLGPWLPDSYPRATVTGAVFCSALTTKTAVYVLIRGFYGWEILVPAGVIMALYGVVYAVLANDVRELLAYHIISQVGYMVAGTGLGTELAVNGAVAHAVCHILYKSVLFMGAGAVIYTTGRERLADLGGFVHRQKLIFVLYMIGGFSISGFPLFNGFVSKSMVTAAAHELHRNWVFLGLMWASVGTFLHTGLKLPYNVWFGEDKGIQPKPAPWNMIAALAIGGVLCTLLGVYPKLLYDYLPFAVHWEPYTTSHLVEMIQLLLFTFFAFYLFIPKLGGGRGISMDTDVFYRKPAPVMRAVFVDAVGAFFDACQRWSWGIAQRVSAALANPSDWIPGGLPRISEDEPGYDEDRNRRPLGVSLALTLAVFVVVTIWALRAEAG
jgi:multicomponent Na+:H+ antiporter subunit D